VQGGIGVRMDWVKSSDTVLKYYGKLDIIMNNSDIFVRVYIIEDALNRQNSPGSNGKEFS
jgi:hypothetical protein